MNQPAHREVLECASPLALSDLVRERKSGRGLPQSKTLARQRPPRRGSWFQCVRQSDSGAAALLDGLISGRDYPKRASAAPAAAISGVCRDGDLLAKIIHVQPALRKCVGVRLFHSKRHDGSARGYAVAGIRDKKCLIRGVRRLLHHRPGRPCLSGTRAGTADNADGEGFVRFEVAYVRCVLEGFQQTLFYVFNFLFVVFLFGAGGRAEFECLAELPPRIGTSV